MSFLSSDAPTDLSSIFVFCTMRGGNRGIAMITLIAASPFLAAAGRERLVLVFFALDFGNFVFYYTVFGLLLLRRRVELAGDPMPSPR